MARLEKQIWLQKLEQSLFDNDQMHELEKVEEPSKRYIE